MKYLAETHWKTFPSKTPPAIGHRYFFPIKTDAANAWSLVVEPQNEAEAIVFFAVQCAPHEYLKVGLELELALIRVFGDIKIVKQLD